MVAVVVYGYRLVVLYGYGLVVDRQMYMWTRIGGGQADVYGSGKEYVGTMTMVRRRRDNL